MRGGWAAGRRGVVLAVGVVAVGLVAGCAQRLVLEPVGIEALAGREGSRTLAAEAKGEPSTGRAGPLPAGLVLQPVGRIAQGTVFRPVGREVAVVGEDREEAYPVVRGGSWTGYYLPFEKSFLGLKQPVSLSLEQS